MGKQESLTGAGLPLGALSPILRQRLGNWSPAPWRRAGAGIRAGSYADPGAHVFHP